MATPNEKLAASLTILRDLQKDGRRVFRSQELGRTHRERLLRNGFLQEVMKGWLISVVCVLLGILRLLLQGSFRGPVAPLAGAIYASPCGEHCDSITGDCFEPQSDEQQNLAAIQHVALRP